MKLVRSRYLLLADKVYIDRAGRRAKLAYSARRATLFALDEATAEGLRSGDISARESHRLAELKREVDARSDASNQRIKAAKERAARQRSERVKAAQTALAQIKRQRQEREERRVLHAVGRHRARDAHQRRTLAPRRARLRSATGARS